MKSSLCAANITELIYFPLKISQHIAIKSLIPAEKSEYTPYEKLVILTYTMSTVSILCRRHHYPELPLPSWAWRLPERYR